MTTRIVGLGQLSAGDDAVGMVVTKRLRERPLPSGVEVVDAREPSMLIPLLEGATRVIVVDAVVGPPPGQVMTLRTDQVAHSRITPLSTHGMGVVDAITLSRMLSSSAAADVVLVAIGIDPAAARGTTLSTAVAGAVDTAVTHILKLVPV